MTWRTLQTAAHTSHHLPSSPLTCRTLDQQQEEGEEQVQDPHGWRLSWVFTGLQRGDTKSPGEDSTQ